MTSPISGISGFSSVGGVDGLKVTDALGRTMSTSATDGPDAPDQDFAGLLSRGLESVQASQAKADNLAVQAAEGTLQDPAQYTMAANEAQLGMQLTLAVRNKAVEAFQEIMRMQA